MQNSKKDLPVLLLGLCFLGFVFWFSLCNRTLLCKSFATTMIFFFFSSMQVVAGFLPIPVLPGSDS